MDNNGLFHLFKKKKIYIYKRINTVTISSPVVEIQTFLPWESLHHTLHTA